MAYSTTGGTVGSTSNNSIVSTLISTAELQAIYNALGTTTASIVTTLGTQSNTVTQPDTIILVDDTQSDKEALLAVQPNAAGGFDNIGQYATYVTNNTTSPTYIVGTSSASFVEYQGSGPATIDGGTSQRFIADTELATGNNVLDASSANNSYSYLIGGPGSDTINGSTNSTASSVVVAGSGPTLVNAGAGAATVYGGGATTMIGGTHAGQIMVDFTPNSHDSIQAGTGGHDILAAASGMNTLDDRNGNGTDTVFSGSGQDTLLGSSAGTTFAVGNGVFDIVSTGADSIYVAGSNSGVDTISGPSTGSVFDTVHFSSSTESATQLNDALASAPTDLDGGKTITFTTTGSSATQTVHVLNATHITFT